MLLFLLGFIYGSFFEFFVHKKLLHGLGKKSRSPLSFHLREHHIISRKNFFYDLRPSRKESIGIFIFMLCHLPMFYISSMLCLGMASYAFLYLVIHNLLHRNPDFAKKYFWWHWNHHMSNQNKSFNVVLPLADIAMRTLEIKSVDTRRDTDIKK